MLRILIVAPSLRITGGQSVQAARLMEELNRLPGGAVRAEFQAVDPALPGPLGLLQRIKYVRTIATETVYLLALLARVWRYDVIHLFSAGYWSFLLAPAPGLILGKLFRRKTVLNYRNGTLEDHLQRFPRSARIMAMASRIVPPSGYLVEVFRKFGLPSSYIFNIIDAAAFPYRERVTPQPRFFHNRGMEELYNIPCTLQAFAQVQTKYPEASLTLAHDGPLRASLEAMVAEMGLRNVMFVGAVNQARMKELYDAADIYLMSPNGDNMPGSVLECYATGLPIVSTAAGGVPYILDDGRTGLLVPLNDHQAMARAALRLLEEPGLAVSLARAGRAECERYTGPAVARQWEALYRELVDR